MADERPLGVFDSGVGGLTVVREIQRRMPEESVVYLGDTARVPYGNKSREAVQRYAMEDARFLMDRGVKALVVACNTASAFALEKLQRECALPVIGVIIPGVEAALNLSCSRRIGIIGTAGTIGSRAYQEAIAARVPEASIVARPTPLLVPLIEENWLDHRASRLIAEEYLEPFFDAGVDTLVLACTHYPMIEPLLASCAGGRLQLVNSASTCARHVHDCLEAQSLLAPAGRPGEFSFFLTDLSPHFFKLAERFLETPPGAPVQVRVDGD